MDLFEVPKEGVGQSPLSRINSKRPPQIEPRSQETEFHGQDPDSVDVMLIKGPRRAGINHRRGTPGLTSDPGHEDLEIGAQLRHGLK